MNGIMNRRSVEDEEMILEIGRTATSKKSIISNSWVMIYDARPQLNAQANRIKNGGFESKKNYKNADIEFCDIDNIHEVTKVHRRLQELVNKPTNFARTSSYLQAVEGTSYFRLI